MLFSSVPFAIFFIIFFFVYWFIGKYSIRIQNFLLLAGSYFFYAWWDWRFLILLAGYSLLNYTLGHYIYHSTTNRRKYYLTLLGSITGIGLLIYFKYSNFFITSFVSIFAKFNIHLNIHLISIALPLGISFYTFRTLSYIYDIKNNKFKPTGDWVVFFSFVSFFPCLLSGPIDRAKTLIPQLEKPRVFDYDQATDALRQILWGVFKKIVIADNLAVITDITFNNFTNLPGSTLVLASFYYAIQLYADFSGYSDMAIGFARLLGFEVTKNFNFPFFSQNIAEFWRKWHMSLTSWLTEYLFIPLSMNFRDYGNIGLIAAILINFTVIGLWHGANWTYVLFGLLHGLYFIPLILNGTINKKKSITANKLLPSFKELSRMILTFILVSFSFILFRADNLMEAFQIIRRICSPSIIAYPAGINHRFILLIVLLWVVEWLQRHKQYTLQINNLNFYLRTVIYYALLAAVIIYSSTQVAPFIYLKF